VRIFLNHAQVQRSFPVALRQLTLVPAKRPVNKKLDLLLPRTWNSNMHDVRLRVAFVGERGIGEIGLANIGIETARNMSGVDWLILREFLRVTPIERFLCF
jgi:hypothetical protein